MSTALFFQKIFSPALTRGMHIGLLGLLVCAANASAQPTPRKNQPDTKASKPLHYANVVDAQITGQTLSGKAFTLSELKNKVVLLVFWTTDCNVCLDIIPELRNNSQGWTNQPFHVLLVSNDADLQQLQLYQTVLKIALPAHVQLTQVWSKGAGYSDNLSGLSTLRRHELPVSALIDKQGKVLKWFKGRIPADAWNDIADLL
jgi:thiol-disulfide isomerase/thioredoxin